MGPATEKGCAFPPMILDVLAQAPTYHTLGPRFAAGLDWLSRMDPGLPDGHQVIAGDDVYALVQSYETLPSAEKKFEAHRIYADIQYVVAGLETIEYAPLSGLRPVTDYDTAKDFQLYADPAASTPLRLGTGSFAIFYPADAHRPGCIHGGRCHMKKVVIKVRV